MYTVDLSGKNALVTGGGRGLGRAIGLALASAGAKVAINFSKDERGAQETVAAINKISDGFAYKADVSKEEEVDQLFRSVIGEFTTIDIVVNNAGIKMSELLVMTTAEQYDAMMAVNARGAFLCTRAALKHMTRNKHGRIIAISSIVGVHGNRGQGAYAMSKAALIALTKSASKEAGQFGITVNAVAPGFIETDIVSDISLPARKEILKTIPVGRFGTPEDVAAAVLFLASPMASYINGQVIGVDGGEIL
jgi:3-oxoacyl-[acyl-carrier protein] reductase